MLKGRWPKRGIILALGVGLAAVFAGVLYSQRGAGQPSAVSSTHASTDSWTNVEFDPLQWEQTSEGDFRQAFWEFPDTPGNRGSHKRLSLRVDTRGTKDDTVKFLGVRSARQVRIGPNARVFVDIDWNNQANGCYLSGALIFSPGTTSKNPLSEDDWFKVEYIGVPPGENARMLIASKSQGRERFLYTEGWPEKNRVGRKIGLQHIEAVFDRGACRVLENGHSVYGSTERTVPFDKAHIYLQISSHSNYPPREIFFDNVRVWEEQ